MPSTIYLFSSLGGDERAFMNLDFGDNHVQYMNWLKPLKDESIESYAARYAPHIAPKNSVLVGFSFGGVVAMELSKLIPIKKVILISSAKTCRDVPFYIRLAGKLRLYNFITLKRVLKLRALLPWLFEAKKKEEKNLIIDMMKQTDPEVFNWSVKKICTWKNTEVIQRTVEIHGMDDRVLPYRFVSCDYPIKDGSHLMILNRAEEISELLKKLIGTKYE